MKTLHKLLFAIFGVLFFALSAQADLPFRNHRYDGFKVLTVNSQHIVFIGNSITNMHEWAEAFGNPNVLNRGNSGAVTDEMLENLEGVLAGRPAKIFFMMGTNDLGTSGMNTAEYVTTNMRAALKRCAKESPETEVYIQSILPSSVGLRTLAIEKQTNDSLKKICAEYNATYVDLWDDLMGIVDGDLSLDGLHLNASAYRIWCNKIASYVGSACTYPADATDNAAGLTSAHGMRATCFGMSPIADGDIIMIGDATINGGEWHELLHSSKVKKRASGWGIPGADISTMSQMLNNIFKGRSDNGEPAQVCIYLGASEIIHGTTALATVETNYQTFVENVRTLAPNARILLQALMPCSTASTNTSRVVPFNTWLQTLATEMENVEYVDDYTPMVKDGVANTDYFTGNYIYGKGYAKLSQVLAEKLGSDVTPTTDEEAAANLARFEARQSLANAIGTIESLNIGSDIAAYSPENAASALESVDTAYALLADVTATNEAIAAEATRLEEILAALLPKLNLPPVSTEDNEVWLQMYTPLRNSRYITSNGAGAQLTGTAANSNTQSMWKLVERTDVSGTYNIVNRADGSYINPSATYNAAVSTSAAVPSAGWELSYSNTPGCFIIRSGTVQLNQTIATSQGNAIYNWSSGRDGLDRDDTGCQYRFIVVSDIEEIEGAEKDTLSVSLATGAFSNPSSSYNKLWTSTSTSPQLTFSSGTANNMSSTDDDLLIHVGSKTSSCTYTLTVTSSDYVITGYKFDFSNHNHTNAITLTVGGETFTTSQTAQHAEVTGLNSQTATFDIAGANSPVRLQDFYVMVRSTKGSSETGIEDVTADKSTVRLVYDLQGKRVMQPTKGIYIVNGEKVILK